MSDAFWVSLFGTLTVLITVLLKGWQSDRAIAENTQITRETKNVVANGLIAKVDGVKDEVAKGLEFAKGVLVGRAQILEEQAKAKE